LLLIDIVSLCYIKITINFHFINYFCKAMFCLLILLLSVKLCCICLWEHFYEGLKFDRVSPWTNLKTNVVVITIAPVETLIRERITGKNEARGISEIIYHYIIYELLSKHYGGWTSLEEPFQLGLPYCYVGHCQKSICSINNPIMVFALPHVGLSIFALQS
jgi:hypothetical protein